MRGTSYSPHSSHPPIPPELNSRKKSCERKLEQMDNGFDDVFVEAAQMFMAHSIRAKKSFLQGPKILFLFSPL